MTETEGFTPAEDAPQEAATVVGQVTATADLTVAPAAEPAEDSDGE